MRANDTTGRPRVPSGPRALLARASYGMKTRAARAPALAIPFARARGRGEVIAPETDIVIESFPRCASSFAVAAFRLAQEPRSVRIANHTHMPAQVLMAARRGVPALVLTREPEAAVLSHVVHTPALSIAGSLRGYVRFYEPLLRVRGAFVVGTFEEVVDDFGAVIQRVNARFGTSFVPFAHTVANLERLSREIERDYRSRARSAEELERIIPRPSTARDALKDRLRQEYARAPAGLRRRAETLFETLRPA
jgi:hypothetical protein